MNLTDNPSNYPVDERNPELEEHYRQILGLLGEDAELTQARLLLSVNVRQVLNNGLNLLGVSAPESM